MSDERQSSTLMDVFVRNFSILTAALCIFLSGCWCIPYTKPAPKPPQGPVLP